MENSQDAQSPRYRAAVRKVRIGPRKARLVIDLIRGKKVTLALGILDHCNKRSAVVIKDLLKSAIANAETQGKAEMGGVENLEVKTAYVDQGPTMKRFQPRAYGRAGAIRKRTSSITIMVG